MHDIAMPERWKNTLKDKREVLKALFIQLEHFIKCNKWHTWLLEDECLKTETAFWANNVK